MRIRMKRERPVTNGMCDTCAYLRWIEGHRGAIIQCGAADEKLNDVVPVHSCSQYAQDRGVVEPMHELVRNAVFITILKDGKVRKATGTELMRANKDKSDPEWEHMRHELKIGMKMCGVGTYV